MSPLDAPAWARMQIAEIASARHIAAMLPDELQRILETNNVGFKATDMEHGRQFRFADGAIAVSYSSGKLVWQGKKDTEIALRVKQLCGAGDIPVVAIPTSARTVVNSANNKVFIVYGHDTEAREQLELLLRRMKLEPVILQNLPIAGDTIIEKLESNLSSVKNFQAVDFESGTGESK